MPKNSASIAQLLEDSLAIPRDLRKQLEAWSNPISLHPWFNPPKIRAKCQHFLEFREKAQFKSFIKHLDLKKTPQIIYRENASGDPFKISSEDFNDYLQYFTQPKKLNNPSTRRELLFITTLYLRSIDNEAHDHINDNNDPHRVESLYDRIEKTIQNIASDCNTKNKISILNDLKLLQHGLKISWCGQTIAQKSDEENSKEKSDERKIQAEIQSLEKLIFREGRTTLDLEEKILLISLSELAFNTVGEQAYQVSGPMNFLAHGEKIYSGQKTFLSWGGYKRLRVYPNFGQSANPGDPVATDYQLLEEDDVRLHHRNQNYQCYSLALSSTPEEFFIEDKVEEFLLENFLPVDISQESAQPGDVAVYLDAGFYPDYGDENYKEFGVFCPHMALVGKVDSQGQPTTAISKMGLDSEGRIRPIYEHPINQATLIYGSFYTIFRRKII